MKRKLEVVVKKDVVEKTYTEKEVASLLKQHKLASKKNELISYVNYFNLVYDPERINYEQYGYSIRKAFQHLEAGDVTKTSFLSQLKYLNASMLDFIFGIEPEEKISLAKRLDLLTSQYLLNSNLSSRKYSRIVLDIHADNVFKVNENNLNVIFKYLLPFKISEKIKFIDRFSEVVCDDELKDYSILILMSFNQLLDGKKVHFDQLMKKMLTSKKSLKFLDLFDDSNDFIIFIKSLKVPYSEDLLVSVFNKEHQDLTYQDNDSFIDNDEDEDVNEDDDEDDYYDV